MAASSTRNLFTPIQVGANLFANRIFLAPLTRARAGPTHVPNDLMKEYYTQRASGGLLITECTMIAPGTTMLKWKEITDAVHAKGGKIFAQIWHAGRAAHPDLNDGAEIVAPSAIAVEGTIHTPNGKVPNVQPRQLGVEELPANVQTFAMAAKNSIELGGFDGVEVHAANGYLIDQSTSARTMLEAVTAAVGADRVGIRFSPLNSYNSMVDSDPAALSEAVAKVAQKHNLAYFHVMRADFDQVQTGDVVPICREHFNNTLIVNMGYTKDEANAGIANGLFDAVAFGTSFLANPDLPARFEKGAELNAPDPSTFYVGGAKGYTDYPFLP
ncbi:hypothetical protein AeMF1_009443 [Aphanomyces euteiches]|nr:hypothetical protein AeMF1_009443 [Aphanomyces euteiches]